MTETPSSRCSEPLQIAETDSNETRTVGSRNCDGVPPVELFGRTNELTYLRGLMGSTSHGCAAVVISGERGSGKSALLRSLMTHAYASEALVLSACGRERETDLDGSILLELLTPIRDELSSLSKVHERTLLRVMGTSGSIKDVDRLALNVAVLTLLSNVARRTPILLALDDSHWVDEATRDVLSFIAQRIDNERVVIALSARSEATEHGF